MSFFLYFRFFFKRTTRFIKTWVWELENDRIADLAITANSDWFMINIDIDRRMHSGFTIGFGLLGHTIELMVYNKHHEMDGEDK
jgi:hypothetical protein